MPHSVPVVAAASLAEEALTYIQGWTLASTFLVIIIVAVVTSL
jgi:putative effector of murein hydrolase LrgA (UPF0299 family)